MVYETCSDVSPEIWNDLSGRDPQEISRRTGARYEEGVYHLKFLDRTLVVDQEGVEDLVQIFFGNA